MGISTTVRVRAPELLAAVWLPGTVALCFVSRASTYTGLLDPPLPPTRLTWTFLALGLGWAVVVPIVGLMISLRRRRTRVALVHGGLLLAAGWLCFVIYNSIR